MHKTLLYIAIVLVLFSCNQEVIYEHKEVVFDGIDYSIKPGDNFFNHVNKTWYENAVIAEDQSGVGAYSFLNIPQKKLLQDILDDVSRQNHVKGSNEQMVGDFYASGMDTASINKRGIKPIQSLLDQIQAIDDVAGIMKFVSDQMKSKDYSLVYLYISPDQKNSLKNILHSYQSGLGLPDRDFYFRIDSTALHVQNAYRNYLSTLLELSGEENSIDLAADVYTLEKQLASSHRTRVELRDVQANYNKLSVAEMDLKMPNIGWVKMLENTGMEVDSIDLRQPEYYIKLDELLNSVSLADWKTYLKASTCRSYATILSRPFQDAQFEYSKVLSGQSVQKARTEQMVQRVDRQIGFALGQLYVKRHFNEDAKKRALELVNKLQKSLENRIERLDWMSDSTKVKAKDKLYAINKKIGYPDIWRSYDGVVIERDKFFENVIALNKNSFQYQLNKLNKEPDREEWGTTPSTVTAYYNPSLNEIVFPAGILQPPYFDLYADDAVNYGGIGMVIGHEFTHAFDDSGAQYDKEGNVKNWWIDEDYRKFKEKTQQVVEQYSAFTVLDSVHLNGPLTVGENTADNGGIAIAYEAFKMTEQGQDTTRIGGYTPDQRFFLSIARIWRVKTREAYLRNYVATNSHSPPMWRVNGPLMNFTPFYEAFDVKKGELNFKPESERIIIW